LAPYIYQNFTPSAADEFWGSKEAESDLNQREKTSKIIKNIKNFLIFEIHINLTDSAIFLHKHHH
jgi:hypothetical protein